MDNDLQLLEDFLDGNLSKAEVEVVEERLEHDADLQGQLALLKASLQGIEMAGRRHSIRKIHEAFMLESKARSQKQALILRKISPWWMGVAASLTLLLAFTTYGIFKFPSSFLEENVIRYEMPTMRSGGTNIDELEIAFKQKNWSALLEKVDTQERDRKSLFLAAMAALETEEFRLGLEYLAALEIQNKVEAEPLFQNEVSYYRLILHLERRDYRSALSAWKALDAEKDNPYRASLGAMDKASLWILGHF